MHLSSSWAIPNLVVHNIEFSIYFGGTWTIYILLKLYHFRLLPTFSSTQHKNPEFEINQLSRLIMHQRGAKITSVFLYKVIISKADMFITLNTLQVKVETAFLAQFPLSHILFRRSLAAHVIPEIPSNAMMVSWVFMEFTLVTYKEAARAQGFPSRSSDLLNWIIFFPLGLLHPSHHHSPWLLLLSSCTNPTTKTIYLQQGLMQFSNLQNSTTSNPHLQAISSTTCQHCQQ